MKKQMELKTTVKVFESTKELDKSIQNLIAKAKLACKLSYSPYSKFPVGVAMLLESGDIILGSNQENASFPAGICAERVALSNMLMNMPGIKLTSMAIVVPSKEPAAPCGICRQSLYQQENLQNKPIHIFLKGSSKKVLMLSSVKSILPLAFSF